MQKLLHSLCNVKVNNIKINNWDFIFILEGKPKKKKIPRDINILRWSHLILTPVQVLIYAVQIEYFTMLLHLYKSASLSRVFTPQLITALDFLIKFFFF